MNKYLLSHGDDNYSELVALTSTWHRGYCDVHGYDLRVCKRTTPGLPDFYWEKYRLILDVMAEAKDGDFIVFLDCDALIVKSVDLYNELCKEGFASYDIAAAKYPDNNGFAGWNLGSIFINVNPRTRKYFRDMMDRGPVKPEDWGKEYNQSVGWEERRMAMDATRGVASDENDFRNQFDQAEDPIRILSLDSKWNYGHAVRPLGTKALNNTIILHPAERPKEFKLWCLQQSIQNVIHGNPPVDPLATYHGAWKVGNPDPICKGC